MSTRILTASLFLLTAWSAAPAAGRNFGFGLVLGDPTGFSMKYWTSATTALDFNVGSVGTFYGGPNGPYDNWGYSDDRCYENGFYNRNPFYCDGQRFNYRDRNGYGWNTLHLHADYLFHNFNAIRASERFGLFYGPGVNLNYWGYDFLQFGVRGNFGIAWMPQRVPMDVFVEIAPVMEIFPYIRLDVNAGLGSRFYF